MPTLLITGANRGLGLELTRLYLEDGWRVIAASRRPQSRGLETLAARHPGTLQRPELDVTDPAAIAAVAAEFAGQPIDLLFHNAGVYGPDAAPFGETPADEWLEVFRVNAIAPLKLTEALVQNVASSRGKLVAVMTSLMGSVADNGSGGYYPYRSSKAALNMVAKSLSVDLRALGITVVAIHPGWARTDMGGEQAPLSVGDSCAGVKRVLDGVTDADNGGFLGWDGDRLPW